MSKYPIITYDFPEGEKKNPFDINTEAKSFGSGHICSRKLLGFIDTQTLGEPTEE